MVCCLPISPTNTSKIVSNVEFKIPDCDECEILMILVISKLKGVASWVMNTEKQTIAVTGKFNLDKLLKKLMKETNKEVEIVTKEEKDAESEIVQMRNVKLETIEEKSEEIEMVQEKEKELETVQDEKSEEPEMVIEPNSDENKEMEKFVMFSDVNPNAKCAIM